jgi:hypothetical protein
VTEPETDALEGDLHSVADEEWLAAHRALLASGAIPAEEAAYLYDPDRDPADVTPDDLTTGRDPKEPGDA